MTTPNTSMTATGLGNVEGQGETQDSTMDINRDLLETLDRYAGSGSGEESVDKSPGDSQTQTQSGGEEATTPKEDQTPAQQKDQEEKDTKQQAQQAAATGSSAVMCS